MLKQPISKSFGDMCRSIMFVIAFYISLYYVADPSPLLLNLGNEQ